MSSSKDGGRSTRIQPGERRNPHGRPRKPKASPETPAFEVLRGRKASITVGGVEREVSLKLALEHQTLQSAFNGDRTAIRDVLKWITKRHKASPSRHPSLLLIKQRWPDPRRVDDAVQILEIASSPGNRKREKGEPFLQLEPWVVVMALKRPAGKRLRVKVVEDALAQTRDGDALRNTGEPT